MDLLEILKTVGSLSGISAAAFLVWDRYTKHFPVAIIVPRPLIPGSQQIVHRLYIKNVSDRPILVNWEHGDANQLRIAKDESLDGIFNSQLRGQTVISLDAGAEALLPILKPGNYDQIDPDNSLQVDLRWRFAQPLIWKPDRRASVWIKKRDFDSMVDGYLAATEQSA
jgi:hypothetical protein